MHVDDADDNEDDNIASAQYVKIIIPRPLFFKKKQQEN